MRSALAAFALIAACGDNADDPRIPRSGGRLKLVHYEYEGGTVERERGFFYDNTIDALCYEETWSDGARYCTPDAAEAVYLNTQCSIPIGLVLGPYAPKFFATYYTLHDRPLVSALYHVSQPTLAPTFVYRMTDLGCAGPFVFDDPAYHWYNVGPNIPIADARIRHSVPEGTERLVDLYVSTVDGLRLAVDAYDQKLDFTCRVAGDANAPSTACKPAVSDEFVSYFTDAACSAPVMPLITADPPTIARREDLQTGCKSYFKPTHEILPESLYQVVDGQCVPELNNVAPHYYDVQRLDLANVERRRSGYGRAQTIEVGELAITDRLLFDAELGTDCERVTLESGELRCLPTSQAMFRSLYADATCQQTVDVALVPSRECDRPETYVRDADVHAVLDVYPTKLYELSTGDRCGEYPVPAGYVPHAIGPALPFDTFPLATMQFDP